MFFYNDYNDYIIEEKQSKNRFNNTTKSIYRILYAKYYFGIKIRTYFRMFEDWDDYNEHYDILESDSTEKLLKKYNKSIINTSFMYIQPNHVSQQPINNNIQNKINQRLI